MQYFGETSNGGKWGADVMTYIGHEIAFGSVRVFEQPWGGVHFPAGELRYFHSPGPVRDHHLDGHGSDGAGDHLPTYQRRNGRPLS